MLSSGIHYVQLKTSESDAVAPVVVLPLPAFRNDIAGLRALAIVAVLCYHLWTDHFRIGYIGVDIFFVLSGYLMMGILSKSTVISLEMFSNFYYKRIKRICPLYYFVFLTTACFSLIVFSFPWLADNFDRFRASLFFWLNIDLCTSYKFYFDQGDSNQLYLHGWSLSVEMQFYLLVPLIFAVYRFAERAGRWAATVWLLLLSLLSLLFSWSPPFDPPVYFTFYHPFSRLWQFAFGMMAAAFSRDPHKEVSEDHRRAFSVLSHICFFFCLFVLWPLRPAIIQIVNFRYFFTTIAALFLLFGSFGYPRILDASAVQYTAKISYALYLVHWPVLTSLEYYGKWHGLPFEESWLVLLLTVPVAVLVHHCFEKPLLRQSAHVVSIVLCFLLAASVLLYWQWRPLIDLQLGTNREKIMANMELSQTNFEYKDAKRKPYGTYKPRFPFGYEEFPDGNGTASIVVLGNSYATQQMEVIRRIIGHNYSTLRMYAVPGNQVLYTNNAELTSASERLVAEVKPTLLFILSRYGGDEFSPFKGNGKDQVLASFLKEIDFLSKHAEHIFIESPQPVYPMNFLNTFVDQMQRNLPLEHVNMNLTLQNTIQQALWLRMKHLFEHCKKCHLLRSDLPFIDKKANIVKMYDNGTRRSYVDNTMHLTSDGLRLLDAPYSGVVLPILRQCT